MRRYPASQCGQRKIRRRGTVGRGTVRGQVQSSAIRKISDLDMKRPETFDQWHALKHGRIQDGLSADDMVCMVVPPTRATLVAMHCGL